MRVCVLICVPMPTERPIPPPSLNPHECFITSEAREDCGPSPIIHLQQPRSHIPTECSYAILCSARPAAPVPQRRHRPPCNPFDVHARCKSHGGTGNRVEKPCWWYSQQSDKVMVHVGFMSFPPKGAQRTKRKSTRRINDCVHHNEAIKYQQHQIEKSKCSYHHDQHQQQNELVALVRSPSRWNNQFIAHASPKHNLIGVSYVQPEVKWNDEARKVVRSHKDDTRRRILNTAHQLERTVRPLPEPNG